MPAASRQRAKKAVSVDSEAAPAPARARAVRPAPERGVAPPLPVDDDLCELALRYPHATQGLQYARHIVGERIPACRWVRLACARHEKDLTRIGARSFPYVFDIGRAEKALRQMQMFREVKGPRAGKRLIFAPWQKFVLASVFGWVHRDTKLRRFRAALVCVPRGNGKTTMAAPLGLYMTALDGEGGAEVYSAAVTRDQAKLVFGVAQHMARRDKDFLSTQGVEVAAHVIVQESSASTFKALSRDAQSLDGLNVHCAILDELAQHPTAEVFQVLETATGKRAQALLFMITTSGSNLAGIGHMQWKYAQRVLTGNVKDEEFFGVLYTIDDKDDWTKRATWIKANPNWGVSVMPDVIERLCKVAQNVASSQNAFQMKHLNVWTNADVSWMNMQLWHRQADPELRIEQFEGEECVDGVDLSTRIDLASKATLFRRDIDGITHYYAFVKSFLPQAAIDDSRNASYSGWAREGWITTTPGEANDIGMIEESVREDHGRFVLTDVAYDPWQAASMAKNLEGDDIPNIEYRPTVANFSPPMKELDALVRDGRFHHDGNPVLAWAVSCVRVREDQKGNIYPRKDKTDTQQKIDPLVALLMAFGRWMAIDADQAREPTLYIMGGAPTPVAPGSRTVQ